MVTEALRKTEVSENTTVIITYIPIEQITSSLQVRSVKENGLKKLQEKIKSLGLLAKFPLSIIRDGKNYKLVDGNHRLEAAKREGLTSAPCHILEGYSELNLLQLAIRYNEASETIVPTTFIDQAEFVWKMEKENKTQQQVADILGWSRGKVSQYAMLKEICTEAWNVIATAFINSVAETTNDGVAEIATGVAFTEFLLRDILQLTSSQQLELVQDLAAAKITKGKFKTQAQAYRARNEMIKHVTQQLGNIEQTLLNKAQNEILAGRYDKEWIDNSSKPGQKLGKLIDSIREEWQEKNNIQLINGDFYKEVLAIGDSSIDLIITDPPYNLNQNRVVTLEGRSNISYDFGEWDKQDEAAFIGQMTFWVNEFKRILKPNGTGIIFTSTLFISDLRRLIKAAEMKPKQDLYWCKTNPAISAVQTGYTTAVEIALLFTKGNSGHTFNWPGQAESLNYFVLPICQGNERLKDNKGNTLHPTQKPERLIRILLENSSNRGDLVFDGFMGTGTTAFISKQLGRKFIGIEKDSTYFSAAKERVL